jgi:hypothetical protein
MKEIYEQALCVFAELGPASEDEELAIDDIILIARLCSEEIARIRSANNGVVIADEIVCPFMDPYDAMVWKRIDCLLS